MHILNLKRIWNFWSARERERGSGGEEQREFWVEPPFGVVDCAGVKRSCQSCHRCRRFFSDISFRISLSLCLCCTCCQFAKRLSSRPASLSIRFGGSAAWLPTACCVSPSLSSSSAPACLYFFFFCFISSLNPLSASAATSSLLISNARFLSDPLFRWIYRHEGWVCLYSLLPLFFSVLFLLFSFHSFNFLCLLVCCCCCRVLFVVIFSQFHLGLCKRKEREGDKFKTCSNSSWCRRCCLICAFRRIRGS